MMQEESFEGGGESPLETSRKYGALVPEKRSAMNLISGTAQIPGPIYQTTNQ